MIRRDRQEGSQDVPAFLHQQNNKLHLFLYEPMDRRAYFLSKGLFLVNLVNLLGQLRMLFLLACMVVKYGVLDSCRQAESSLAHCLRFICIF